MSRDPFVVAAEEVATAGRVACEAINAAVRALEVGARERETGAPLLEVVDGLIAARGRDVRLSAADAFHEFERAIADMRAGVVRTLLEDEGLSLTEVAARLRISRQAVARLQQQAQASDGPAREM